MKLLLDTHIFLWFALNDQLLSPKWMRLIEDSHNEVFLSVASLWEISIKSGLGKLALNVPFQEFADRNVRAKGIALVPIRVEHLAQVPLLPYTHKDPFDRLLIAQSIVEGLEVMTNDSKFKLYPVSLVA